MSDLATFAASIAEPIDQIRIHLANSTASRLFPLLGEVGLTVESGQTLGNFRHLAPNRSVRVEQVHEMFIYQPHIATAGLELLAERAYVALEDGEVALTPAGLDVVHQIFDALAANVAELWTSDDADFAGLASIARKVIEAAAESAGDAFGVVAPMHIRPGTSAPVEFSEQLTPLRFSRFDAHIAAWRAEGLTVEQITTLEDTDLRARIEAETNSRAGTPYAVLSEAERTTLLDALHALVPPA